MRGGCSKVRLGWEHHAINGIGVLRSFAERPKGYRQDGTPVELPIGRNHQHRSNPDTCADITAGNRHRYSPLEGKAEDIEGDLREWRYIGSPRAPVVNIRIPGTH